MSHRLCVLGALLLVAACAPAESAPATATVPSVSGAPLGAPPPTQAAPSVKLRSIQVVGDRLELGGSPEFEAGKAELIASADNDAWLATIVDYLSRHPEVTKLRIEGHTDGTGASAFDDRISQDRADRLVGLLIDRGIGSGRVHGIGYGKTRPIMPNNTAEGRAANRRIEVHVEELSGAPLGNRPVPH
jgi:outer membrane protein OmpA-like peptidoglycan-associated protein